MSDTTSRFRKAAGAIPTCKCAHDHWSSIRLLRVHSHLWHIDQQRFFQFVAIVFTNNLFRFFYVADFGFHCRIHIPCRVMDGDLSQIPNRFDGNYIHCIADNKKRSLEIG